MAKVRKRTWDYKGETKSAWILSYVDQNGNRKQKTFEKKKDADFYRDKIIGEIQRGEHTSSGSSLGIEALANRYIDMCEIRFKEGTLCFSTLYQRRGIVSKHITPHFGMKKLADLTYSDVDAFRHYLLQKELGPRRVRNVMQTLKQVEEFGLKRGYTSKQIVARVIGDIRLPKPKPIGVMNVDQIGAVLRTVDQPIPWWRTRHRRLVQIAVHLAVFCGLRFGEIRALSSDDIDLDRRIISVRHSLEQWRDVIKSPKTAAGVRDIPMPIHIAEMLREWLAHGYVKNKDALLLTQSTASGRPVSQVSLSKSWRTLQVHAGVWNGQGKAYNFHSLRHFASSFMVAMNIPLPDVAALMGHDKFDLTLQVYAHPIMGDRRRHEAFDRMSTNLLQNSAASTRHESISH